MERQQRFSFRKYKFGLASVLLASLFVVGTGQVQADEATSAPQVEVSTLVADDSTASSSVKTLESGESSLSVDRSEEEASTTPIDESRAASLENPLSRQEDQVVQGRPSHQEEARPNSISSNELITVPETWKQGYKGEGTVVAVIDSGLDINHEVFRITDPSKAKYKNPAEMEKAKKEAGIDYGTWYSDKVVFAYDYFDGQEGVAEEDPESHGTHVSGIAVGNSDKPSPSGQKVYGVAPEAQLMFLRVFSDRDHFTNGIIYSRAIDDAVALGADSINMSLGSPAGSLVDAGPEITDAIKRARAKGVSVIISAGNSTTFGNGHSLPAADHPDYGVVGNPGTVEETISVASINNKKAMVDVFDVKGLEDHPELDNGKFSYTLSDSDARFEKGREYEYVSAGFGREQDFKDLDLTGKIALIQRGENNFVDKVLLAKNHGAAGVVIYNNVDQGTMKMGFEGEARNIPSVFITKAYGEALKDKSYKIVFKGEMVERPSADADQMTDFTSWGLTSDGFLKPDVTAPGGNIYSSFNHNTYGSISGTSMAAPHVAGVAALVTQYLKEAHPELSPEEITATVKALIMSTAKPHLDKDSGAYTSPRQQGAGVVDTQAAVTEDLYLTARRNYSSASLGNVGERFSFDVTIHNLSSQDRTLKTMVNTNTDQVKDGYFQLRPRKLLETAGETVTVKAHSSQTITVQVDTSQFTDELQGLMPNGYYLEGFVRFLDPKTEKDVVSLPFTGFKGDFQNLPALETPIYNLVREGKNGFYYHVPEDKSILTYADVSAVTTETSDQYYSTGEKANPRTVVLGTAETEFGKQILQLDADGNVRLAISPNGDGNQDFVQYKAVAYRNIANLRFSVYKASDTERKEAVWQSKYSLEELKNYYDWYIRAPKSYLLDNSVWKGVDQKGKQVADGLYDYVVTYQPDLPGAKEQSVTFKLQIDTQKPVITSGYIVTENGEEHFIARKPIDVGQGGIAREQVFYLTAFDDQGTYLKKEYDAEGYEREHEQKTVISVNADGSYTLPKGIDRSRIFYQVEDYAGNRDYISLAQLVKDDQSGRVKVAFKNVDTKGDLVTTFIYRIKDQAGKYVTLDKGKAINFLPFGHYTAELFSYDRSYLRLMSDRTQEFDITPEDSFKTVEFFAREVSYYPVSIAFDQAIPDSTPIVLKSEDGERVVLPFALFGEHVFGRKVIPGKYRVIVTLPTGYELVEDEPVIEVLPDRDNRLTLSVVSKLGLLSAINQSKDLLQSVRYLDASKERQLAYSRAYQLAEEGLKARKTQAEIDQLTKDLEEAIARLNGGSVNNAALQEAINSYQAISQSSRYINARSSLREAYDQAYRVLRSLQTEEGASESSIQIALKSFEKAQKRLNGRDTDFSVLKKLLDGEGNFQLTNAKFIYASKEVKEHYLETVKHAQEVLANPKASNQEVKEAIKELKRAKRQLNGKKPKAHKRHG